MNDTMEARTYKAVVCRQCREPIPVPAIVVGMEASAQEQDSVRVFILRCRACDYEHPYRSTQMVEVQGEPRVRRPAAKIVSPRPLARAAGA